MPERWSRWSATISFLLRSTAAGQKFLGECEEGSPYPGAKPCFLVSGEKWEEREWLSRLIQLSAADLDQPKKKSASASQVEKVALTG